MMERREFFKVTAGVVVTAATQGMLVDRPPELPDLPDPDYDKIVTSAFPVSEHKIGAEDFQIFNLHFPRGGGEAKLPGFTYIKGIKAEAVDKTGCKLSVMPKGPWREYEVLFHTPVDGMTTTLDNLWIRCQDGVIKTDGEAELTVHCWRPKVT